MTEQMFEPIDRDVLIKALADPEPSPFFTGKEFGWKIVAGRDSNPTPTILRCYWTIQPGTETTIKRIELSSRDLNLYLNDAQMAAGNGQVMLRGTFTERLQLEVTADGTIQIEQIDQLDDLVQNS